MLRGIFSENIRVTPPHSIPLVVGEWLLNKENLIETFVSDLFAGAPSY